MSKKIEIKKNKIFFGSNEGFSMEWTIKKQKIGWDLFILKKNLSLKYTYYHKIK